MKKSVFLLIVLILGLTGCTKSFTNKNVETLPIDTTDDYETEIQMVPETDAKLVIWEDSATRIEYMEYVAEKFKEEYGIDVEVQQVVDFSTRMIQDAPAGLGPDLLESPHDQVGTLLTAGLIQPNDTVADEVMNDFASSVSECLSYEDQIYGYPLSLSTYLMIYNKDIVGDIAPETFQDIFDFAETFNDPTNNKYAIMWQVSNSYFSHAFIAGYGGYVFGNRGTDAFDIGLNTEAAIEGVTYLKSFKSILDVNSADMQMQVIDGLFTSGKLAYTISGQWAVTQYQNAGINVGVCALPKMENGETPKTYLGVQTVYVNSYTKYPNAAKLFAEMAISEEMLAKRYEITKEIPARTSLMENDIIKNDEITSAFMKQAESSVPMPSITQMNSVWDPYSNAIRSIWDNDDDPKEALNKCVDTINALIK